MCSVWYIPLPTGLTFGVTFGLGCGVIFKFSTSISSYISSVLDLSICSSGIGDIGKSGMLSLCFVGGLARTTISIAFVFADSDRDFTLFISHIFSFVVRFD